MKARNHMSSPTTTQDAAVLDVLDRMYTAWADGDADTIARLYLPDATVVMPGVLDTNSEQVRDFFSAGFAGRLKGSRGLDEPQSVRFVSPDAAIVISEGGILMAGETSVPAARQVRATWVLARRDGDWRIAAYHNCALQAG
jgi:uncharacterized protein (TIGR02246 family)